MEKFKYLYCDEGREKEECIDWGIKSGLVSVEDLIIRDENEGVFKAYKTYEEYEKDYDYEGDHLTHEVILGWRSQKQKFDMDGGDKESFKRILEGIERGFKKEYDVEVECVVYDSSNAKKFSRHIVVINRLFKNSKEADNFTRNILKRYISEEDYKNLDVGVNKSTQNFRMPGGVKDGRKKRVEEKYEWYEGLITYGNDCMIVLPERCEKEERCVEFIAKNITDEQKELIRKSVGNDFEYNPTRDKNNILVFDRIRTGYCGICERDHNRSGIYVCIFEDRILKYCFRNDDKKYEVIWE